MKLRLFWFFLVALYYYTQNGHCISWNEMSRAFRLNFRKDGLSKEIRKGVTVDQIQKYPIYNKDVIGRKMTPLVEAIKKGNADMVLFLLSKRSTARDHLWKTKGLEKRALLDILFDNQMSNPDFVLKVLPGIKKALYNDFRTDFHRKQIDDVIASRYMEMMNQKRIKEGIMKLESLKFNYKKIKEGIIAPISDDKMVYMKRLSSDIAAAHKNDFSYYNKHILPELEKKIAAKDTPPEIRANLESFYNSATHFDADVEYYLKNQLDIYTKKIQA